MWTKGQSSQGIIFMSCNLQGLPEGSICSHKSMGIGVDHWVKQIMMLVCRCFLLRDSWGVGNVN